MKEIALKNLVENEYNPRKRFEDARMADLKKSIEKVGLAQGLTVRPIENGKYEVVCGMRRLRALNDLYRSDKKIPVNVVRLDDQEAKVLSITENIARADLTPIEEARAYAKYITDDGYETNLLDAVEENLDLIKIPSQDHPQVKKLAEQIGKYTSADVIRNRLYLLMLPEEVQTAVENREITINVAQELSRLRQIKDTETREKRMEVLAEEYKGSGPDLKQLRSEVSKWIQKHKEKEEKSKDKLDRLEGVLDKRRGVLQGKIDDIADRFEDLEEEKEKDIEDTADNFIKFLQKESNRLATGEKFDELQDEEIELQSVKGKLEQNVKEITEDNLDRCPFCGASVSVPNLKDRIEILENDIMGVKDRQKKLNERKANFVEARKELRGKHSSYKKVKDAYEKLAEEVA